VHLPSLAIHLGTLWLAAAVHAAPAARPNVLLVCVDDLKPMLGCYGDASVKSPHIDQLARRGIVFEAAYCNQAVCAPSRNTLMTGKRPTSIGVYDLGTHFRLAVPDAVTLSQHFIRHGYRAEAMGKILHVGHGNHEDAASWSVPHWRPNPGPAGGYARPENRATRGAAPPARQGAKPPNGAAAESADVPDSTYGDGKIADEAIRRLQAAKERPAQPFFLAVGFLKPHLPFIAPQKYWDLYERSSFDPNPLQTPPAGAPDFAPTTWGELRNYSDIPQTGPLTAAQQVRLIHGYHAAVSYMDAQLGRLLDELDRLGLTRNTIIVLWGDHGWHLGDHGMWCKHTNYEQATRIPVIVSTPGTTKAGGRCRALIETADIYPTLCELAGLPVPAGLDGSSFAASLTDPASAKTKDAVFHVYPRTPKGMGELLGRAVRTDRYRMVEWKKAGAPADTAIIELYDYATDPNETKNIAGDQPETVARLRAILAKQPEAKPQLRVAGQAGARPQPNAGAPPRDRAAMFAQRDRNKDEKLDRAEFMTSQPDPEVAQKRFGKFDSNGDGVLSRNEFIQSLLSLVNTPVQSTPPPLKHGVMTEFPHGLYACPPKLT
jgi:iduronate 2-sulfatase